MRQILFYLSLEDLWILGPGPDHGLLTFGLAWIVLALVLMQSVPVLMNPLGLNHKTNRAALIQIVLTTLGIAGVAHMMMPVAEVPVYGYGAMLMLALLSGCTLAGRRAVQHGLPSKIIWDLGMVVLVAGIMGARAFWLVQYRHIAFANVENPVQFFLTIINLPSGGLVLYGGVLFAGLCYFLFCLYHKISPLMMADIVTPSVFLGLCFGRLGCLLNGCCYGDRCDLPWAISFPPGSVPYMAMVDYGFLSPTALASLPLHPSQVYSAFNGLFLCVLTSLFLARREKYGQVLALGWILYPIMRFLIEFVRGDEFTQFQTGLTISQLVSLGMFACGVCFALFLQFYGRPIGNDAPSSLVTDHPAKTSKPQSGVTTA